MRRAVGIVMGAVIAALANGGCRCDKGVGAGSLVSFDAGDDVALVVVGVDTGDAAEARNCPDPKVGCAGIEVVGVRDGDSLRVVINGHAALVRLAGIDAPERKQPFGLEAEDFLAGLVKGRTIRWRDDGNDKFGRSIGIVFLDGDDGKSLNHRLVEAGLAWHYVQFSKDPTLAQLEADARDARRGLWSADDPVPPWDFRSRKRDGEAVPLAPVVEITDDVVIVGNVKSRKYHLLHCAGFMRVGPQNRVAFESVAAAEAAGYVLSGNCRP